MSFQTVCELFNDFQGGRLSNQFLSVIFRAQSVEVCLMQHYEVCLMQHYRILAPLAQ